jgi:hypothetical protein
MSLALYVEGAIGSEWEGHRWHWMLKVPLAADVEGAVGRGCESTKAPFALDVEGVIGSGCGR